MSRGLSEQDTNLVATMESIEAVLYDEDTPFRIALLGDWSGRANRRLLASSEEIGPTRPLLVDRDNLDQVMSRLGARLELQFEVLHQNAITIDFKELGDFHPDSLFRQLQVFESLQRTRAQLRNQTTFPEAAAVVRSWSEIPEEPSPATALPSVNPQPPANLPDTSEGGLLDQILSGTSSTSESTGKTAIAQPLSPEIAALAREAVKPYATADNEA
jgi:type VI secretion system ImpB/VipA family protein